MSARENSPTIKSARNGEPGVCYAAFMGGQGAKARSIAYCDDGTTPTLRTSLAGENAVPEVVCKNECYGISRSMLKGGEGSNGGMPYGNGVQPTMTANGTGAVCFQQNRRDEVRDLNGKTGSLLADSGAHNTTYVCYGVKDSVKCLNPWDVQSKHIMTPDGASEAMCSGEKRCGALPPNVCYETKDGVCYSIEGHVIDRNTSQNGRGYAEGSAGGNCYAWTYRGRDNGCNVECQKETAYCLREPTGGGSQPYIVYGTGIWPNLYENSCGGLNRSGVVYKAAAFMGGQGARARSIAYCDDGTTPTIRTSLAGGNAIPEVCYKAIYDARGNGDGKTSPTLTGDHQNRITDYTAICVGNGQMNQTDLGDKSGALNCMHDQQIVITPEIKPDGIIFVMQRKYIVRRLTPTECARLQGFPDEWTDGADGSDSAKYKLWGNGIALPCAEDVIGRIADEIRSVEMGNDGEHDGAYR